MRAPAGGGEAGESMPSEPGPHPKHRPMHEDVDSFEAREPGRSPRFLRNLEPPAREACGSTQTAGDAEQGRGSMASIRRATELHASTNVGTKPLPRTAQAE